jgi:transcriptional regulator with XRE-family HTH domain
MLGERLVELRGKRTQQFVADQLEISRSRYSHYENNHVQPDNKLLRKMAQFYNVSIDYLLNENNDEFNASEQKFLSDLQSVSIDQIIQQYPLIFMGRKLELSQDDKRAILAFIKALQDFKNNEE